MEVKLDGFAEVIEQLRILYINLGIPGPLAGFMVLTGMLIWRLPEVLRTLNERKKINLEAERRATLLNNKLKGEIERRRGRVKK